MQEVLVAVLKDIAYVIIIGVVPILAKYITSYLQSKKDSIAASTDNLVFENTVTDALSIIQRTVDMVSQTYVEALKKEGTFTVEAQKEAFSTALKTSKSLISSDAQELLASVYGDLDSWIKVQIESYILDTKKLP